MCVLVCVYVCVCLPGVAGSSSLALSLVRWIVESSRVESSRVESIRCTTLKLLTPTTEVNQPTQHV